MDQEHDHPAPRPLKRLTLAPDQVEKDPVCGMTVPADAPLRSTFEGKTYVFCNPRCRERFEKDPRAYLPVLASAPPPTATAAIAPRDGTKAHVTYVCPMDPEIRQAKPGPCPKCGMALEPEMPDAESLEQENPELRAMTRRFWVGVALSVPLVLIAMGHMLPGGGLHGLLASSFRPWLELALATPMVLWGGWPFFTRAARSVARRSLT